MPIHKVAAYIDSKGKFISSVYVSSNTISNIYKCTRRDIDTARRGPLLVATYEQVKALDLYLDFVSLSNIDNLYFPDGKARPRYMYVDVGSSANGNQNKKGTQYLVGTVMYTPDNAVFFILKISSGKSRLIELKSTVVNMPMRVG